MDKDFEFRFYPKERLLISSKESSLEREEQRLRRYIMETIIDQGQPFNLEAEVKEASLALKKSEEELKELYRILEKKGAMVVVDGSVNFIYPVSALPTAHQVTLADGRQFSAMCAIDAIGCNFTFKQDITINSKCSYCGEAIELKLSDGEIVYSNLEDTHVLHVDLNKNTNWAGEC